MQIDSKFWADQFENMEDSISNNNDKEESKFTLLLSKYQKKKLRKVKNVESKTHNTRARAGYKNIA